MNIPSSSSQAPGNRPASPIWHGNPPSMGREPTPSEPSSPFISAVPASDQEYVATVNGERITANELNKFAMFMAPYLKWSKNQLNERIQRYELTGTPEERMELRN